MQYAFALAAVPPVDTFPDRVHASVQALRGHLVTIATPR